MSHMWVWRFSSAPRDINFLGRYRARGKPLISLNHDANMYIFQILFILRVCVCMCTYLCVCTMCVQVPVKPEGVKAPGTGMTGSSEMPNMGAGDRTWAL